MEKSDWRERHVEAAVTEVFELIQSSRDRGAEDLAAGSLTVEDVQRACATDVQVVARLREHPRLRPLLHPSTLRAAFERADVDHSGTLELGEFVQACSHKRGLLSSESLVIRLTCPLIL